MANKKSKWEGQKQFEIGDIVYNIHKFQTPYNKDLYDFSKPLQIVKTSISKSLENCQIVYFASNTGATVNKNHNYEPFVADWFDYFDKNKTIIKKFNSNAKITTTGIKLKSGNKPLQ